jgi:hypothetical protein
VAALVDLVGDGVLCGGGTGTDRRIRVLRDVLVGLLAGLVSVRLASERMGVIRTPEVSSWALSPT